ncbi:MAG: FHA domain-containing protein, partial [Anaerolineales bacterium]|nr:FHA domain-containing protein [Anaerolineales bacterium]
TIGRTQENDIVLNVSGVSRQHAKIERSGAGFTVTDLNSTNGSFLDDQKLLPGIPEPWDSGRMLRIGSYFLSWRRGAGAAPAAGAISPGQLPVQKPPIAEAPTYSPGQGQGTYAATQPAGPSRPVPVGATQMLSRSGEMSLTINPTNVKVEPGGRQIIQVDLLNTGATVDHFMVNVHGIPADWYTEPGNAVHLMPGASSMVSVTFHPPRQSSTRAGDYDYEIVARSQSRPNESASVTGRLTVGAFHDFRTDMRPATVRSGRNVRLLVQNTGNAPMSYVAIARDPSDTIQFEGNNRRLEVQPGERQTADIRVSAAKRPFIGSTTTQPFSVELAAGDGAQKAQQGQLQIRPILPTWIIPLAAFFLIGLCAISLFGINFYRNLQNDNATLTAEFVANINLATADVLTRQFEEQQVAAQEEQAQNATATALYLTAQAEGDDDNDGLSNNQEAALGTQPDNPDTDGDGLSDGEEVNRYGTQPKNIDTDGDGLVDGAEVEAGTSPINPDSDGDGVPDGLDDQPLATPIPTDTPTGTPTPTTEPTETFTPTPTTEFTPTPTATVTPTATATESLEQDRSSEVSVVNNRTIYYIRLTEPGLITVNASWTGAQSQLSLLINGPGQQGFYARQDGSSELSVSYQVTADDFDDGDEWRVTVASFGSDRADGTITISYPSGSTDGAFETTFVVVPSSGSAVKVLVLNDAGPIEAEAEWNGDPNSLALIVNGPGQVNAYARQDSDSPVSVNYTVTASDFSAGDYWRVSLTTFSVIDSLTATMTLTHP